MVQNPELLRRYPPEDHKDFILPGDVTYFCQPEACLTTSGARRPQTSASGFRDTTSFVFTLTEKDSAKIRYGICVNFFRPYERQKQPQAAAQQSPECQPKTSISGTSNRMPNNGTGNNTKLGARPATSKRGAAAKRCQTLTSLCIISHHPFFTTFRHTLTLLRKLIDACNERAVNGGSLGSSQRRSPAGGPVGGSGGGIGGKLRRYAGVAYLATLQNCYGMHGNRQQLVPN